MTDREELMYDSMIEDGICTAEEINLVRNIMSGSWEDVLNAICYVRTGYKTYEQFLEEELEDMIEDCENWDFEVGFNPYSGCYDYDC